MCGIFHRRGKKRKGGWFRESQRHREARLKALRQGYARKKKARDREERNIRKSERSTKGVSEEVWRRTRIPMLTRVGGKTKIAGDIVKRIPPHKTYVEPFVGGGSVFFKKEPAEVEVINDKDRDIAGFYKGVKSVRAEDIKKINMSPSRERYNRLLKLKPRTPKEQVEKTLYLNKRSWAGKMGEGNYAPSFEKRDKDRGVMHLKQNAHEYQQRLKNVKVYNRDFEPVIKQYDSKNTFFYLDPPYYNVSKKIYVHEDVTPVQVHNTVKGIKGKFLLSYNNVPEVRKEFKDYNIKTIKQTYELRGGDNKQPVTELLISNYKIK